MALDMANYNAGTFSNFSGGSYQDVTHPDPDFTDLTPRVGATVYYASYTSGSDASDGLTIGTQFKTLAKAADSVSAGDMILLKAGDDFTPEGKVVLNGMPSGIGGGDQRTILGVYGVGSRPKVLLDDWTLGGGRVRVENYLLQGLDVYPDATLLPVTRSTFTINETVGNIQLEDCKFNWLQLVVNSGAPRSINWRISKCIFHGAFDDNSISGDTEDRIQNFYISNTDGIIIEDIVSNFGGWNPDVAGASPNQYSHNMYMAGSCGGNATVNGNILCNGSSHGVQQRNGGFTNDNFCGRNAHGYIYGTNVNSWNGFDDVGFHSDNNVVSEVRTMKLHGGTHAGISGFGIRMEVRTGANPTFTVGNTLISKRAPLYLGGTEADYDSNAHPYPFEVGDGDEPGWDQDDVVYTGVQLSYQIEESDEGEDQGYPDPNRTLGTYYDKLVIDGDIARLLTDGYYIGTPLGADSFDKFMWIVQNRERGKWDSVMTAKEINRYMYAGFGVFPYA